MLYNIGVTVDIQYYRQRREDPLGRRPQYMNEGSKQSANSPLSLYKLLTPSEVVAKTTSLRFVAISRSVICLLFLS